MRRDLQSRNGEGRGWPVEFRRRFLICSACLPACLPAGCKPCSPCPSVPTATPFPGGATCEMPLSSRVLSSLSFSSASTRCWVLVSAAALSFSSVCLACRGAGSG